MSIRVMIFAALLFASGCATVSPTAPAVGPSPNADLIIQGGTVVTISGENIPDGAVVVADGKIVAVGARGALVEQYSATTVIDATGKAVLPGFVNAHTHAPMTLFRGIADDRDLMEWLQNYIFPAEAKTVDAGFVRTGTRLAAAEMIASGTTTYADMYYFEADIADETSRAGLRGVLGETLLDFPAPDNKTWEEAMRYARQFVEKYKNDPLIVPALAPHAPYTVSEAHLREVRALATELGAPILIHVAETKAEIQQIDEKTKKTPVAYLDSVGLLGDDVVAAHGVWLSDSDIKILAARKVGVAHCPESNMMLASGVAPVPALRSAGVDVGLGTDGPAGSNNNLDMIEEMASAARLQKITKSDPKALSARAVLEMATIGGARTLGLADRIGTIEVGKAADLIVIDLATAKTQPVYSIESAVVYAASGSNVTDTVVNGRVLMRDRKLLTVDVAQTLREAEQYRQKVTAAVAR